MYSKNPITKKVEANIYLSDILNAEKRISVLEGAGGGEALDIATQAKESAQNALDILSIPEIGVVDKSNTAKQEAQTIKTTASGYKTTALNANDKVFGTSAENPGAQKIVQQMSQDIASANDSSSKTKVTLLGTNFSTGPGISLLDCFVNTSIHLADLDLLHEVGATAHDLNPSAYPFSHFTDIDNSVFGPGPSGYEPGPSGYEPGPTGYEPGPSEYAFGPTLSANLMSAQSASADLSHIGSWESDLPSLTTSENFKFTSLSKLDSFTGMLPNLVIGTEMFKDVQSAFRTGPQSLPSLVDGTDMFNGCTRLTNAPYELPSLVDGTRMYKFAGKDIIYTETLTTYFNGPTLLPNLEDGTDMFNSALLSNLVPESLPSLEIGVRMYNNTRFSPYTDGPSTPSSFAVGPTYMPALTDGTEMFYNFGALNATPDEIPMLENGTRMYALEDWSTSVGTMFIKGPSSLPSITNGTQMFENRHFLETAPKELDTLVTGTKMFKNCHSLVNGPESLRSLEDGTEMFMNCPLSFESFKGILQTLPASTAGHAIFLGGLCSDSDARSCLEVHAMKNIKEELVNLLNSAKSTWTITVGFYTTDHGTVTLVPSSEIDNLPAGITYQS